MIEKLQQYRKRLDGLLMAYRSACESVAFEKASVETATTKLSAIEEAQGIVQSLAQAVQQRVHRQISTVVSRCLEAVFEEPYEFSIRFDRKRGKTEAAVVFSRDGIELEDPLNEVGGGVVDVASLALRLSCLVLSRPQRRRFLALDEPFKNVRGAGNRRRTRDMLERLADDFGLQVLLNTDIEEYRLGSVVELGFDG